MYDDSFQIFEAKDCTQVYRSVSNQGLLISIGKSLNFYKEDFLSIDIDIRRKWYLKQVYSLKIYLANRQILKICENSNFSIVSTQKNLIEQALNGIILIDDDS